MDLSSIPGFNPCSFPPLNRHIRAMEVCLRVKEEISIGLAASVRGGSVRIGGLVRI